MFYGIGKRGGVEVNGLSATMGNDWKLRLVLEWSGTEIVFSRFHES